MASCWALVLLTNAVLFSVALGTSPPTSCGHGWAFSDYRCFRVFAELKTMADAEFHCMSLHGHLASIHSLYEDNFVRDLIHQKLLGYEIAYIGLFDAIQENKWMWTDGSKFDYHNWGHRQPSDHHPGQDCVHINYKGNGWNDLNCLRRYPFVCARPYLGPPPAIANTSNGVIN